MAKLGLNGCIYRRLMGFGSNHIVARCGLVETVFGEIVAYGGSGGAAGFVAGFSGDWLAWGFGVGDLAGFGWLRFSSHVCHDRERALHWHEARFGADGSEGFSSAHVHCVLHWSVGVSGAAGLLLPKVRGVAGACLILLLIAMFPANVRAAREGLPLRGKPATELWLRVPMQGLFIGLIWWASR